MNIYTVIPAYGRKYDSFAYMVKAWKAGYDFKDIFTNRYMSIRDVSEDDKVFHHTTGRRFQ